MEGVKTGRRRIHEVEYDTQNQIKRRRKRNGEPGISASVQILGETQGQTSRKHPNCVGGRIVEQHESTSNRNRLSQTRGREKIVNGGQGDTHSSSTPSLPPSLRESERMLFVQRWINSIPLNSPLWVQVSLTKIVPITNPRCYPTEELTINELEEHANLMNHLNSEDPLNPNHQSVPHEQLLLRPSRIPPNAINQPILSAHQQISTSSALPMLGPRFPNAPGCNVNSRANFLNGYSVDLFHNSDANVRMNCANGALHSIGTLPNSEQINLNTVNPSNTHREQNQPGESGSNNNRLNSVRRLFGDIETHLVVKLFRDYFTKGSCPILKEVRKRIMNTFLENRRTASGIRAKIKRLQKSGRWTDYTGV